MTTIAIIIGTILLLAVAIMEVLLIIGLPFGEFTMGGQNKVLPPVYRIFAASSILVQLFGAAILLQAGGYMGMWFSSKTTRIICYVFAGFFAINTFMNAISRSKKEKYAMTPLAMVEAICFFLAGWSL